MKQLFKLLLVLCAASTLTFAQAPQALNYQAVARDNAGVILANTNLDVRFTVKQTTATGTTVFQETHATATDAMGGFTLEIGRGTASTGSFTAINWAAGPYFLEVELDVNSSGSYTSMGTSEMLSVPYSQYANRAGIADSLVGFSALFGNKSCYTEYDNSTFTVIADSLTDQNNNGTKGAFIAHIELSDSNFFCRQLVGTRTFAAKVNGILMYNGVANGFNGPCTPTKSITFVTNENSFTVQAGDFLELYQIIISERGIEALKFEKQL